MNSFNGSGISLIQHPDKGLTSSAMDLTLPVKDLRLPDYYTNIPYTIVVSEIILATVCTIESDIKFDPILENCSWLENLRDTIHPDYSSSEIAPAISWAAHNSRKATAVKEITPLFY
jgi:hypothetical protein